MATDQGHSVMNMFGEELKNKIKKSNISKAIKNYPHRLARACRSVHHERKSDGMNVVLYSTHRFDSKPVPRTVYKSSRANLLKGYWTDGADVRMLKYFQLKKRNL